MNQSEINTELSKVANELRMPLFSHYERYIDPKLPFAENLLVLLLEQAAVMQQNRVARRIKYARFPQVKTLDMFEMSKERLPSLNFEEVKELAACRFIDNKLDVVAIGPPGHGKTHLALAIGYEAAKQGYTVKFKRVSDLVNEMREAQTEKKLADYLRIINRCQLLILDEMGYLNFDLGAASLLFQVIGARYETASTFYTTNVPFSGWTKFIGDEGLATAIVDRIAHHAVVLNMNGPKGWRLEHAQSGSQGK